MSQAPPAFLPVWTLAIVATASAFVVHLALRSKTVQLGYELGRVRQDEARLREVKRVLELEAASYKTPERVEIVARMLLGMEAPPSERIVPIALAPSAGHEDLGDDRSRLDEAPSALRQRGQDLAAGSGRTP
jgi:cell division protein FtsL